MSNMRQQQFLLSPFANSMFEQKQNFLSQSCILVICAVHEFGCSTGGFYYKLRCIHIANTMNTKVDLKCEISLMAVTRCKCHMYVGSVIKRFYAELPSEKTFSLWLVIYYDSESAISKKKFWSMLRKYPHAKSLWQGVIRFQTK